MTRVRIVAAGHEVEVQGEESAADLDRIARALWDDTPARQASRTDADHSRIGVTRFYWLTGLANANSRPTRAELDAGVDLSADLALVTGFGTEPQDENVAEEASMRFYPTDDAADLRQLFRPRAKGYVAVLDEGDRPNRPMRLYPAMVTSTRFTDKPRFIRVDFAITSQPTGGSIPGAESSRRPCR